MNKQFKRNKSRVWRKSYGKPFLIRRAMHIALMAVTTAQGVCRISQMNSTIGSVALKAVYMAEAVVATAKAIKDQSHEMNKGFVTKQEKK